MLDTRTYLILFAVAGVFWWGAYTYPNYWPLLAVGFVLAEAILILWFTFRAFVGPGRLLKQGDYEGAIRITRRALSHCKRSAVQNVMSVYLALALLGRNRPQDNAEAGELLGKLERVLVTCAQKQRSTLPHSEEN